MSMRDLVSGGDKGPSNPLAGFAKHFDSDRSLDRETVRPDQQYPDARFNMARDDRFAEEFFQQEHAGPAGPAFRFDDMRSQLAGIHLDSMRPPEGAWAEEFDRMGPTMHHPADIEFERYYENPPQAHGAWHEEFFRNPDNTRPLNPQEFAELERFYHQPAQQEAKITELSEDQWAAEYATSSSTHKGKEKAWADEFETREAEYNGNTEPQFNLDDDSSYMDELENMWQKANGPDGDLLKAIDYPFSERHFEEKDYDFEPENLFLSHPAAYEEGLRLMETGNLSDAALAFEAAVQHDAHNAAAWLQLGLAQAENEKETAAIRALQRAVKEDPHNMPASLALAVSYTNEGAESQAFDALEKWIRTKYPTLPPSPSVLKIERHSQVVHLYLSTVQQSKEMDPDVQVGLGVLFNISCEYEKAIDCFQAALHVRPDDYLLWNRLGATLANGGRSEEAIDAYYQALDRKPSFVRARYNLGVSCINIGCLKEAAEHFLGALALHGSGSQRNVSNNLWDTLKRTFVMMDRRDLIEMAQKQDINAFRGEFDF